MKKVFLILFGIIIILSSVIFVIYKNNYEEKEEVVDIFKEEDKEETKEEEKEEEVSKVTVDIKGMINTPGVYEVDSTYRVNDVIELAGGLKEGADTSKINLAKLVKDEMTIIIYSTEEVEEEYKNRVCICNCPEVTNDACIEEEESNDLININTCTEDDLMSIKGIGKAKAEAIIKYREDNGNYSTIEDIKKVSGIGDALFEKIKVYITV